MRGGSLRAARMIDVGGYRLSMDCSGVGNPAVILDSGPGEHGLSWFAVQRAWGDSRAFVPMTGPGMDTAIPAPRLA